MDDPLKQTPFCELDRDNRVMTLKDLAFTRISLSELEALHADNKQLRTLLREAVLYGDAIASMESWWRKVRRALEAKP